MAQCTGGTIHDLKWDHKHDAALRFLKHAADRSVGRGVIAAELDRVLAIILNIFGDDLIDVHRNPDKWYRDFAKDLSTELHRLKPSLNESEAAQIAQELQTELMTAANKWKLGDPEKPRTEDVLNVLEHILFRHRVIHNSPKQPTPISLREEV